MFEKKVIAKTTRKLERQPSKLRSFSIREQGELVGLLSAWPYQATHLGRGRFIQPLTALKKVPDTYEGLKEVLDGKV